MSDIVANKEIVRQLCQGLNDRNSDSMAALFSDEATWWIIGRPDRFPAAGMQKATDLIAVMREFSTTFAEFSYQIVSMVAESDQVVVRSHSRGKGFNGRAYENDYSMHVTVTDGKIASIYEYLDPLQIFTYEPDFEVRAE